MAGTSVVWEGLQAFDRALGRWAEQANNASRQFVSEGLHMAEAAMKEHAGEGGRHKRGTPTPAVQGFGPAVVSGTLRRSIRVSPITPAGMFGWEGEVGPTAIYGRRIELEYNYPYAGPGWEETLPFLPGLFRSIYGSNVGSF